MENAHVLEASLAGDLITSDAGMTQLTVLADQFGGRAAGSPEEAAAGAYLTEALLGLVGAPLVRHFRYTGWQRGEEHLAVVSPLGRRLDALSLPGCPGADLEAELVSVGDGEAEDFARVAPDLRGKIVLCGAEAPRPSGQPPSHRRVKYRRAAELGASAFLYAGRNPGMLAVTGGLAGAAPAPIPGFGLALEVGAMLERLLARGAVTLRVRAQHGHAVVTSSNITVDIPGHSEELILVGAHYDGHDIAQAATDNGSGTATLLELARALAPWRGRLQRGVRCCFWGSEEAGLLGSWHYVRTAGAALDPVVWVLNLDSVVNGPPGRLRLRVWPPPACEAASSLLQGHSLPVDIEGGLTSDSDHFPFAATGLPVIAAGAAGARTGLLGRGWGHTAADTVDKVDPAALSLAVATAGR
ncbi:MAG TPA: M28 family peptidase, partial [Chloroflexota bacterium]|nr:M28 family peptidase [Chloroflexota bacterium]